MSTGMGRKRGGRFADRPRNVDLSTVGDTTYFIYVYPDGRKKSIGNSRETAAAYSKAEQMNAYFAQKAQSVDLQQLLAPPRPRGTADNPLMPVVIDEFRKHDPKRKTYSETTLQVLDSILNVYGRRWVDRNVKGIITLDCAQALNDLTDAAYVKHRPVLYRLFQFAGHQGYIESNPVAITLEKDAPEKVRDRHTWEGYQAILNYGETPDWLRRAMQVGLYSLQRRDDVVKLHRVHNKVDLQANTITVLQRKTRNYKRPVWIEIEMGTELRQAVEECLRSDIPCPYLIHYRPARLAKKAQMTKVHPFSVTPGYLTNEFRRVRDEVGAYDHLPVEQRPTFHELRALGAHLYEQAGYTREYMMALSGHASEKTLEVYLKDHVAPKPRRVAAGLGRGDLPS